MATSVKEWNSVKGKDGWLHGLPGPWADEPDKVQWVDEETGLDCLIVRGPVGALCGYAGVPPEHPWHGVGYTGCPEGCGEDWCDHRPDTRVEVHGGLTFASGCNEPDRESWERVKAMATDPKVLAEAKRYPEGEAARRIQRARDAISMGYEAWAKAEMGRRICHVAEDGRPDDVWWFGFDCAHSGDLCPGMDSPSLMGHGTYRSLSYVRSEVEALARQLAARNTTED